MRLIKFMLYWLPSLLWMALIYYLSSFHKLQASVVGWQDFITRKTAHFMEYALLFIFYNFALKQSTNIFYKKRLIYCLVLTIIYAISDEYHQTWVNGRTGKPFDIGIDSFGAFFGLFVVWKFSPFFPEKIRRFL